MLTMTIQVYEWMMFDGFKGFLQCSLAARLENCFRSPVSLLRGAIQSCGPARVEDGHG